jgi:two-component system sensor histidine kinase UhpB
MRLPTFSLPIRITLIYLLFAMAWILFSDTLLSLLIWDTRTLTNMQSVKGSLFAVLTALLLYVALVREVRRREQVKASQRASEASFRLLFMHNPIPMWVIDAQTMAFMEVNDAAIAHYGYTRDEFLRMTIADIRPSEDVSQLHSHAVTAPLGYHEAGIWRHRRKDGACIDVSIRRHTIEYSGRAAKLIVVEDITERLRAEKGLRRANRALRMLTDCNQALVRATDEESLLQSACRTIVETGEYCMAWVGFIDQHNRNNGAGVRPVAQYDGCAISTDAQHPDWATAPADYTPTETAIRSGRPIVFTKGVDDLPDVPWRSVNAPQDYTAAIALPMRVGVKTLGALHIYAHDSDAFDEEEVRLLSELADDLAYGIGALHTKAAHATAEQSLETTSSLLRGLFDASPAAILVIEPGGAVQLWNPAAERIFGRTAPETLNQFVLTIPAERREEFRVLFERVLSGELVRNIEFQHVRHDGACVDVLLSAAPLRDASNVIYRVMSVLVDITDRKQAEAALAEREMQLRVLSQRLLEAQEGERRRIARELHDEIGQALTIIKLGVQSAQRATEPASVREVLSECIRTIDAAIQQVRSLSLDLRPSLLDDLGLIAALRWYLDRQAQWVGFAATFHTKGLDGRLPSTLETTCFRVAQEALTNIARHAHAHHVTMSLTYTGHQLVLCIQDDGVGFDVRTAHEQARQGGSLGLLGMQERVALVGGRLTISAASGHGAQICASFPVPEPARPA